MSLLYIGDTESESQKHNRFFKAVFFRKRRDNAMRLQIFSIDTKNLDLSALYLILVMLEYIYSTRGVYLLYSKTVGQTLYI